MISCAVPTRNRSIHRVDKYSIVLQFYNRWRIFNLIATSIRSTNVTRILNDATELKAELVKSTILGNYKVSACKCVDEYAIFVI